MQTGSLGFLGCVVALQSVHSILSAPLETLERVEPMHNRLHLLAQFRKPLLDGDAHDTRVCRIRPADCRPSTRSQPGRPYVRRTSTPLTAHQARAKWKARTMAARFTPPA